MNLGSPSLRIVEHIYGPDAVELVFLAIQDSDLKLLTEEQVESLVSGAEPLPTTGRYVAIVESDIRRGKQPVDTLAELLAKRGFCIARDEACGEAAHRQVQG